MSTFNSFNFIADTIFTVVGVLGNLLKIYIFSRPMFLNVSMFRYLFIISITNILNILSVWPISFQDFFLISSNSLSCKLYLYLNETIGISGAWILVLSSFDRYLSIKHPHLKFRNKFKYQISSILSIVLIIGLINIPIIHYFDIRIAPNRTICFTNDFYTFIYVNVTTSFLWIILPFLIMIISSLLIIYTLIQLKKAFKKDKQYRKLIKFAQLIVYLDFYFLACNLPGGILNISYSILVINDFNYVINNAATYNFFMTFTTVLNDFYFAFDFFVFLCCNKLFRKYFFSMCSKTAK